MPDRISLHGIDVFAYHGVLEHEQTDGQLFSVDVDVDIDLSAAAESDDLARTIDYGALAEKVHSLVASERWDLIERVADRVADLVMTDDRVLATTVTVHKPDAPIPVPFRDVAVTVTRQR